MRFVLQRIQQAHLFKSARCRIDVPVEYVEERSAEVDVSLFTNDPCPLAKGKVFVPAAEGSSTGKGSRFIAKGERSCNGEGAGIPKGSRGRIQVRFISFIDPRDHIDSR